MWLLHKACNRQVSYTPLCCSTETWLWWFRKALMVEFFLVILQDKWETSQLQSEAAWSCQLLCGQNSSSFSLVSAEETLAMSIVTAAQDYVHTFLQSLKKFFLKISFVVYSWSSIFAKNVATSSALVLSFMTLPTKKGFLLKENGEQESKS